VSVGARSGEIYYTDEELEKAMQNNNALQYAMSRGYPLIHIGNEYHLKEHDSMVFLPNGKWHWNSQDLHGHAIDFIQAYENRNYKEAVCILAGTIDRPAPVGPVMNTPIPQDEKREFVLPERADNYKIIFAYLIKERGVDEGLVKHLVLENKLFQSKAYNNLVMVGFDNNHIARYASQRSTNSFTKIFKRDVAGSDKSFPFIIESKADSDTVRVFESPIEAMSYWTICKESGSSYIQDFMLSKGGASTFVPLDRFLNEHPQVKNIVFCLNNDSKELGHDINAGMNATANLSKRYQDKYNISTHMPHLNDWNDVLKNYRHNLEDKMNELRKLDVKAKVTTRSRSATMER
jgi:hypothetical protein